MRETTVSLIPKEQVDYLKDDKKFFEFITNELTKNLSERVMQALEENDDIVIKKPVLRVSEYPPTHSVEYRKILDWEPLVRCKDCKHWCIHKHLEIPWCRAMHIDRNAEDFCSDGERREG